MRWEFKKWEIVDNSTRFISGEISVLLRQNFKGDFKKKDSASYKMLSGNVERDVSINYLYFFSQIVCEFLRIQSQCFGRLEIWNLM